MIKVRFSKIKNNHSRLRDDVIDGETHNMPMVDKPFFLFSEGRDTPGTIRAVNTNVVVKIMEETDGHSIFETASGSVYKVERFLRTSNEREQTK